MDAVDALAQRYKPVGTFRLLDHTADTGVKASDADLPGAFSQAALGMFTLITEPGAVQEQEERALSVRSPDLPSLLVDFLNELNYIWETERFLFSRVAVLEIDEGKGPPAVTDAAADDAQETYRLRATGYGEPFDPQRHAVKTVIKAATYHGLKVHHTDGGWHISVIFDI